MLRAARPTIHVFAGQALRVPVNVEANGLGSLRPTLDRVPPVGRSTRRRNAPLPFKLAKRWTRQDVIRPLRGAAASMPGAAVSWA